MQVSRPLSRILVEISRSHGDVMLILKPGENKGSKQEALPSEFDVDNYGIPKQTKPSSLLSDRNRIVFHWNLQQWCVCQRTIEGQPDYLECISKKFFLLVSKELLLSKWKMCIRSFVWMCSQLWGQVLWRMYGCFFYIIFVVISCFCLVTKNVHAVWLK